MVQTHQHSREEGTTMSLPPKGHGPSYPQLYSCTIELHPTARHYKGQYITGAELPAIQDLYTRRC